MADPIVSVRDLRKSYGEHEAVRGISFDVRRGEVFGFLGTNGAGKTTTIEILEGYRRRSGGEATVLGGDPGRPTPQWRDRIGLVLQESELSPLYTVRETVTMFAELFSRPRPVDETIELVGLAPRRDERMGRLSGGQRRRADVAVALIGDPDLVFLDEPTTGFDPSARREAWNMIEGLKALGKTIFLTTHYMDEAQHLADRVVVLRDGAIVAEGRPDELSPEGGGRTMISFRLPAGRTVEEIRAAVGSDVDVSGEVATIATGHAQRTLHRLTGWAEDAGIELEAIEARRPSLEDVFLALTGDAAGV
jgi:ABC-2 type transport system ATP-binding protein